MTGEKHIAKRVFLVGNSKSERRLGRPNRSLRRLYSASFQPLEAVCREVVAFASSFLGGGVRRR
jgi:hypothetical protein